MPTRRDIERDIALTRGLHGLTEAYEEIAVLRIQKIRQAVLATRAFREGLVDVFADVRASRQRAVAKVLERQRKRRGWRLVQQGRPPQWWRVAQDQSRILVWLSTDARLSGSITADVFREFLATVDRERESVEVMIVGEVGREMFNQARPEIPFAYFPLPTEQATPAQITPLARELLRYENVTIFYGRFVNLVDQIPATTHLFDETAGPQALGNPKQQRRRYFLFEPSLEDVVTFFDTQIFAMLFKQTVDESWLAQLGSRITAMEQASQNVERHLEKLELERRRAVRHGRNRKGRQALAGMTLWG